MWRDGNIKKVLVSLTNKLFEFSFWHLLDHVLRHIQACKTFIKIIGNRSEICKSMKYFRPATFLRQKITFRTAHVASIKYNLSKLSIIDGSNTLNLKLILANTACSHSGLSKSFRPTTFPSHHTEKTIGNIKMYFNQWYLRNMLHFIWK